MRIVIDMQACQSPFSATRGVGRYTDNLVRALLRAAEGHEIYFALNGGLSDSVERLRHTFSGLIPQERILVCQNHLRSQFAINREIDRPKEAVVRVAEITWETFLNSVQPDVIFSPNLQEGFSDPAITSVRRINSDAIYATTLHDLIPYHFQDELLSDNNVRDWYEEKVRYAVESDVVIAVSQATVDDIKDILGKNGNNIHKIHSGFDNNLFNSNISQKSKDAALKKYNIERDFFFYFGGGDPCKNINRLLEGYSLLGDETRRIFPLVLGGRSFQYDPYGNSHNELREKIEELGLEENCIITPGFIPDEDLPGLLAACTCFVFPSTHEGFGLPALEAMACGAPVIGSNQSGVAEIIRTKEALFDPYDVQSIARKMQSVIDDKDLRASLRKAGLRRATAFSWDKAADSLLKIWQDAVAARVKMRGFYAGEMIRKAINATRPFVGALDAHELSSLARMLDETFTPSGRPAIYLDVSAVIQQDDRSGIQRVTRAVAIEMLSNPPAATDVDLVYAATTHDNFYRANSYKRNALGLDAPGGDDYVAFKPGDVLIFLDLSPRMAINHRNYIRYLRDIGVRVYFFVHDLIPLHHPEWFSTGGVDEFRELMDTVATADGAICVSKATADDLKSYVLPRLQKDRRPYRIGYSHLGTDYERTAPTSGMPANASTILAQFRQRPTFLMIGTIEPRKGHRQTLAAFERLWNAGIDANLVIVGRWGWKMGKFDRELSSHVEAGHRLFWLQGISDEFLGQVYDNSDCLLAASRAEGFGLPLIEAAQHGLPIIARDIPVFREVAGDHAEFFPDLLEPSVIAEAVKNWMACARPGSATPSTGIEKRRWSQTVDGLKEMVLQDKWLYSLP